MFWSFSGYWRPEKSSPVWIFKNVRNYSSQKSDTVQNLKEALIDRLNFLFMYLHLVCYILVGPLMDEQFDLQLMFVNI